MSKVAGCGVCCIQSNDVACYHIVVGISGQVNAAANVHDNAVEFLRIIYAIAICTNAVVVGANGEQYPITCIAHGSPYAEPVGADKIAGDDGVGDGPPQNAILAIAGNQIAFIGIAAAIAVGADDYAVAAAGAKVAEVNAVVAVAQVY